MIETYCQRTNTENAIFSIVIPSWNNIELLKLCVHSIQKHSSLTHQIIVHVNDGQDGTLEWVKQQTNLDYTYSKENIGVCFALNAARTIVKTDYFLYINDDMYVCPNWDAILYNEIKNIGHDLFFLSSTVIEARATSNCVIEKNYGTSVSSFNEEKLLAEYENFEKADWAGSTWPPNVLPTKLWDLVGGYSIEFSPGMYSDPDFSLKLWKAGVRYFKGLGASRVYHFGSSSVKRAKLNKGYYQFINKWGFTSSLVTKGVLKRGEIFNGQLPEFEITKPMHLKQLFKRVSASINKINF